ncbi:MAG: hypothetical protein M3464_14360 [Chloroflexota bacterium]|nr:hypothetical protein [Chloroflexota bacterium]
MTSRVKGGRAANAIAIGPDDTLLDVFDRVRAGGLAPVELTIPNDSPLFLTAAEFRTLRDVADHGRHPVAIRTPDPSRVQLAKLFGLDAALAPAPKPAPTPRAAKPESVAADQPDPGRTAVPVPRPTPVVPADQPARPPAGVVSTTAFPNEDVVSTITEGEAVARWPAEPLVHQPVPGMTRRLRDRVSAVVASQRRRPSPAAAPVPEAATAAAGTGEPSLQDDGVEVAVAPDTPRRLHWVGDRARASPLVVAGVALFVVLVIVTALNFLLPSAAVRLELATVPINSALVFDVTADGEPFDEEAAFVLPGTPATVTVVAELSVPTTGIAAIPDGVASGSIRLANPTATEQTVEAGTALATESGADFQFVEPVVVPAADAVTGVPGQAQGAIEAIEPGTVGNVATGEIGGRLPNGVYYSNRQGPTAGGSDREVQTVAPADLDVLRQMVEASLGELVEAELRGEGAGAATDVAIVEPTLIVREGTDTFDQEVGAATNSVSLIAERTVSVLTYDQAVAAERLASELSAELLATQPEGVRLGPIALDAEDVSILAGTAEGARFQVDAAARADLVLTEARRTELAEQLAGKSDDEVAAILDGMPEVAHYEIEPGLRLFSANMPANPGRIEIDDGS